MYRQEDEVLFARTMRGVMANISHLNNERSRSTVWGDDGWKKIVVCVVVDGRKVFNPRTRAMLAALGVYQEGIAKNMVGGKAVVCLFRRGSDRLLMRMVVRKRMYTSIRRNVSSLALSSR